MRPLFLAGNWKMNPPTLEEAVALAEAVKAGVGQAVEVRVAVCPPSVYLHRIDAVLAGSPIGLGAQNMHWEAKGAYTGEVSGSMLNDAGCTHVILGHSERRHGMGETDAQVNRKSTPRWQTGYPDPLHRGDPLGAGGGETLEVFRGNWPPPSPGFRPTICRGRPCLRAGLGDRYREGRDA